ncbi:MAG: hypothetical protein O3A47_05870 [Chloroflexi bacterium]|nr:hypothetical protein [Chloroflexota bacterium]
MSLPKLDKKPVAASLADVSRHLETPAFVYDEAAFDSLLGSVEPIRQATNCRVLFALKAFSFVDVLKLMAPRLDGFAASSLFEARLARKVLGGTGTVHVTTPGLRPDDIDDIASLCDYVSFNSLGQLGRYRNAVAPYTSVGLRVNPQLSFVDDDRYDPCRRHSKLGVPLDDLEQAVDIDRRRLDGVEGIHIHTNCDSTSLSPVLETVQRLESRLGGLLAEMKWVNLGGGYLFDEAEDLSPLLEAIALLETNYGLQVCVEPGAAMVRSAGYVVSSVLDIFTSDGRRVAVLDTTVNHMPEVLEYGYEPDVEGHVEDGEFEYLLAGSTCLAGDLFGIYRFAAPLDIGSRVVFNNAGAYTMSKAHTFNGVNLPAVYRLDLSGELTLRKRFTYEDYAERWGAGISVPV